MRILITDTRKKDLGACMLTTLSFGLAYVSAAVLDFSLVQPDNFDRMKYRHFFYQNFTVGSILGACCYALFALVTFSGEQFFQRPTAYKDYPISLLSLPIILIPTINQFDILIDRENRINCLSGYIELELLLWTIISSYSFMVFCLQDANSASNRQSITSDLNDYGTSTNLLTGNKITRSPCALRSSYRSKNKPNSPLQTDFFRRTFHTKPCAEQLEWLKKAFHIDDGLLDEYIPEEFCCQLTLELMSNPVELPTSHNGEPIIVEQNNIERSLANKKENPYTREKLFSHQLIPRDDIKNKIKLFIISLADELDNHKDIKTALKNTVEQFSSAQNTPSLNWV